MKLYNHYSFFSSAALLGWFFATYTIHSYNAYVAQPIVDVVGEPLPTHTTYTTIPYAGGPKDYTTCPRMHQLLYHERVRVIETHGDQVRIAVPNVFYITTTCSKPESRFWTLKKYLVPANSIAHAEQYLPQPNNYHSWLAHAHNDTVTLTHPYYDAAHNITFSAGTRFIQNSDPTSSDKKNISVYLLDPTTHQITTTTLPTKLCTYGKKMPKESMALFIKLIRSWIKQAPAHQYIPYVWGGASITNYTQGTPKLRTGSTKNSWYEIEETEQQTPKQGCDCSGLIFRAAQIAGIPYFFKNSYTALRFLKPITAVEPISVGDIIWIPGHVMIVASTKKNTLFEERSYEHGYGRLHEIQLGKVFKGIHTYHDLANALHAHQPLYRLDSTGTLRDTFKNYKILRLASAWDITYR